MQISIETRWMYGTDRQEEIDNRLFELLEQLQSAISLRAAATACGFSYRYSWGLIKHWETVFGTDLVLLERGRGKVARLSGFALTLLQTRNNFKERTSGEFEKISNELNNALIASLDTGRDGRLKLFASHGMEITFLNELLAKEGKLDIDFQIHGSLESLQNLNGGLCNIAGFHLPITYINETILQEYRRWLIPDNHMLVKVATRNQGIMLQRKNPKNIRCLKDLSNRSVRFINRQKNSGTRTILDQLLIKENINPARINGYNNEEFTHLAVAAMISSGAADAGFGIQAAARQFDLDFVPYLTEIYILAINRSLGSEVKNLFVRKLRSAKFRQKINSLAGYSAKGSGKELSFSEVLGNN